MESQGLQLLGVNQRTGNCDTEEIAHSYSRGVLSSNG